MNNLNVSDMSGDCVPNQNNYPPNSSPGNYNLPSQDNLDTVFTSNKPPAPNNFSSNYTSNQLPNNPQNSIQNVQIDQGEGYQSSSRPINMSHYPKEEIGYKQPQINQIPVQPQPPINQIHPQPPINPIPVQPQINTITVQPQINTITVQPVITPVVQPVNPPLNPALMVQPNNLIPNDFSGDESDDEGCCAKCCQCDDETKSCCGKFWACLGACFCFLILALFSGSGREKRSKKGGTGRRTTGIKKSSKGKRGGGGRRRK